MNKYTKEAVLWVIILIPFLWLVRVWNYLPNTVAIHFGLDGKANGWADKSTLPFLIAGLTIGNHLLMLVLPRLDPLKKIEEMGSKYFSLRLILGLLMSMISCFIIYTAQAGELSNPNYLIAILGIVFALLGNYFQTIRPNYFVGIRTPWTLSNENVWKRTHLLAGRLWLTGGLLSLVLALTMELNTVLLSILGVILFTIVVVPVALSYWYFQKEGTTK